VRTGAARPRPRKKRAGEHHASAVRRARVARSPAAERARQPGSHDISTKPKRPRPVASCGKTKLS
jgi:hypothetical protein